MKNYEEIEEFWPSISDLMSGLMIIFMFIAISFMSKVTQEKKAMTDLAEEYKVVKVNLYKDLSKEFEKDLEEWNAYLDPETLSVRFEEPEIFFKQGSSELSDEFKEILEEFFPRYINILNSEKYAKEIEEVRIEGHTSTEWTKNSTPLESYFKNMELSQDRTRATLEYVMMLDSMKKYEIFMIDKVTANGLSYSKRVLVGADKVEDLNKSRRVEFRIRTKAEKKIDEILSRANEVKDEADKL